METVKCAVKSEFSASTAGVLALSDMILLKLVGTVDFLVCDYGSERALASRTQNQACVQGRV